MSVHRETFVDLVKQHGWTRGAELGVDKGILFGMLLRACPDLYLTGVDVFPDRDRSRRVFPLAEEFAPRATVIESTTVEASTQVADDSLDFVFIDADHSEPAVTNDIKWWAPKVKRGGWCGGHDYSPKFPGVIAAVDQVFPKAQHWPGTIWGVWL